MNYETTCYIVLDHYDSTYASFSLLSDSYVLLVPNIS